MGAYIYNSVVEVRSSEGILVDATDGVSYSVFDGAASDYADGALATGSGIPIATGMYMVSIPVDPSDLASPYEEGQMYSVVVEYTPSEGTTQIASLPTPLWANSLNLLDVNTAIESLASQLSGLTSSRIVNLDYITDTRMVLIDELTPSRLENLDDVARKDDLVPAVIAGTLAENDLYVWGPTSPEDEAMRNVGSKISYRARKLDGTWYYEWYYYSDVEDELPTELRTFTVAPS